MTLCAFSEVENVEFDAIADFFRAAPDAARMAHAIEAHDIDAVSCLTCRGLEPAAVFRRAVRVGVGPAIGEPVLDEVLAYMDGRGQRYVISVAPQSQPATLASSLEKRGFTRGHAWMKFCGPCAGAPQAETDLEVRVVRAERGGEFGRIVAAGFGLPPSAVAWIGALAGRPSWVCVMAFDAGSPVAAGAAYVGGDYAWLGLGATLDSHRRRGAQNALISLRLAEAAARGARVAVTETGERLPDKPSASYRNILRAGFEEAYLRQNYLSPSA